MFQKFGAFLPINNNNLANREKDLPPPCAETQPEYMEEQQKLYGEYIARHNRLAEKVKNSAK